MLIGRFIPKVLTKLLLAGLAMASVNAQEKTTPLDRTSFKVGKFSNNQVQQEIGYENIGLLTARPELRVKLAEIQNERSQLSAKIVSIKTEGDMQKLQVELRILENKKNLFTQALSSLQDRDPSKAIDEYVKNHWGDKYALIYNSDNGSFSQSFTIISANYTEEDLTKEIGKKIKKDLLLQEDPKK